ncbi:MAG: signal peptide peptidase SppA [Bacteroidales bacterium]|nr:signal peptide peptidase SppA [Bacteroidales bacterium]MBS3774673.1 signal peptide peptidase SppA [Bacteroidales bacterium]
MKSFLKYTLATIVGILITGLLFFIIFFSAMGALIPKGDKTAEIQPKSLLRMELSHVIMDRSPRDPFANFDFRSFEPTTTLGLNEILANIEKAGKDDDVEGIYLDLSVIPAGMATIEEIRSALIEFKDSGKFIIGYADNYMQTTYYLASVADRVYMNPAGRVNMTGLSSQLMFFKEGLDKLGVEPQVIRHGEFKSAVEPFTRNQMSEENRHQVNAYVNTLWNYMAEEIAEHRNISQDTLNWLVENLALNRPETALNYGLVDGLKYKDEVLDELREKSDVGDEDVRFVGMKKYNRVPEIKDYKGLARDKIAVIYSMGTVMMGEGQEGTIGSDRISGAIREARKDTSIRAIVFRVNSGGGSALASEVIWRELQLAQQEKPVVASFGDVAASGGYYIAAPADTIVASPNTLTGSIGVFGLFFNSKELLNDKLGIHVDVAKSHSYSDLGSPFRSMTEKEKEAIREGIKQVYDDFVSHVAEGRDMAEEEVDDIARGRIWSGMDARRIGLIDLYGGMQKAVDLAAEMAELDQYRTVGLPRLKDPFQQFVEGFSGDIRSKVLRQTLGNEARYYMNLKEAAGMEGIQARIPYKIEVY